MTDETKEHGFSEESSAQTHFSWLRTRMSVDRTLMSWIRTAVSLIGFGFTIVQFFEHLAQMPGVHRAAAPHAARYIGLSLIGCGVVALLVSAWQYRSTVSYLWDDFEALAGTGKSPKHTPALGAALTLLLVGVFAFVAVLIRVP